MNQSVVSFNQKMLGILNQEARRRGVLFETKGKTDGTKITIVIKENVRINTTEEFKNSTVATHKKLNDKEREIFRWYQFYISECILVNDLLSKERT